jgi:hypothetical protein
MTVRRITEALAGLAFAVAWAATAGATGPVLAGCTNPDCIRGVPPATQGRTVVALTECSEPKCLSGTQPAARQF